MLRAVSAAAAAAAAAAAECMLIALWLSVAELGGSGAEWSGRGGGGCMRDAGGGGGSGCCWSDMELDEDGYD